MTGKRSTAAGLWGCIGLLVGCATAGTGSGTGAPYRSVAELTKDCRQGNPKTCLDLGTLYMADERVPKDERRAAIFFEMACEGGVAEGCYQFATHAEKGRGMYDDPELANQSYEKACQGGVARACHDLAVLQSDRFIPEEEEREALNRRIHELYEQACNGGLTMSCEQLSYRLSSGRSGPKDLRLALAYLEKACQLGSASSCHSLGVHYRRGEWVPQDERRAVEYFKKACKLNGSVGCAAVEFSPPPSIPDAAGEAQEVSPSADEG
jgi:TPR repeat protein